MKVREVPGCQGCPMFQDGSQGFVPDELIPESTVMVVGQNPGADEERQGKPFVGKTGEMMMNKFFPVAGLVRGENVSLGNAIKCRWQRSNNLPTGKILDQSIAHCRDSHLRVPEDVRLVVAQGSVALKSLKPHTRISVTDWRGFIVD